MTPHLHDAIVEGCYRCDLGRDEVAAAERPEWCQRSSHGPEGWACDCPPDPPRTPAAATSLES